MGITDWEIYGFRPFGGSVSRDRETGIKTSHDYGPIGDDITGKSTAEASRNAAAIQAQYGQGALDLTKEMWQQGRQDLMPHMESAVSNLGVLNQRMGEGAFDAPGFYFDKSGYKMPGRFNESLYGIGGKPQAYQMGPQFNRSQYDISGYRAPRSFQFGEGPQPFTPGQGPQAFESGQGPEAFNASGFNIPQKFEGPNKMPDDFSFGNYETSPYAKFLQDESARAIERSGAAKGGLASGATLAGIQQRAMDIAGQDIGDQFNRQLATYQTNLGKARDERDFGYGQFLDEQNFARGERDFGYGLSRDARRDFEADRDYGYGASRDARRDYESDRSLGYELSRDARRDYEADRGFKYDQYLTDRDFDYGLYTDALGRAERDRAFDYGAYKDRQDFGYGLSRDARRDYETDRDFGYGLYGDEVNRALGERAFDYGMETDRYSRDRAAQMDLFNQLSQMSGMGAAQSSASMGQQYGQGAGETLMGIGNALASGQIGEANARQNFINNLLQLSGTLGGAYLMSDRRLKHDVKKIGKWKEYNVYHFKYLGSDLPFVGVMADEVQQIRPKAVKRVNGFLAVNYGRL